MCEVLDSLSEEAQAKQIARIIDRTNELEELAGPESPYSAMARPLLVEFRRKLLAQLEQYATIPA